MSTHGELVGSMGEVADNEGTPPDEDRGAYRLGVVSAVDFTARPPTLTIGEGEFARPMRFAGSVTQYNTGQTVVWQEQPGAPMVILPVPIMGADPSDPESLEPYHVVGAAGEPAFQNSWVWWGAPQSTPAFYKQNDGWVQLKGSLKNGTTTATMFTLPVGYRPPFDVYVSVVSAGTSAQVTISTTGTVSMPAGGGNTHVALDGICFPTTWNQPAWKVARLQNAWDWNLLLSGAVPEVYVRDDGWCWQKGSITPGTGNAVWGEFPQEAYGRSSGFTFSCFNANGFTAPVQMDLHYSGEGVYRNATPLATVVGNCKWFGSNSAGVVAFTAATLQNAWTWFNPGTVRPPAPGYYKDHFGVVHLQGVANGSAKTGDTIFTLPVGYRPLEDQVFLARDRLTVGFARVDVKADGTVVRVSGDVTGSGQFSLQHAAFRAEQ